MSDEWCEEHDGSHCSVLLRLEARLAALEANQLLAHRAVWEAVYGPDAGRDNERDTLLPILQDLIAELRTTPRSPSARPPLWVRLSVAHAEARLREVQGE